MDMPGIETVTPWTLNCTVRAT